MAKIDIKQIKEMLGKGLMVLIEKADFGGKGYDAGLADLYSAMLDAAGKIKSVFKDEWKRTVELVTQIVSKGVNPKNVSDVLPVFTELWLEYQNALGELKEAENSKNSASEGSNNLMAKLEQANAELVKLKSEKREKK